jgi:hypothetical protein
MIDRRMAFLAIVLLLASPVLAADDPAAPIVAIYRIVSAGDGTIGGYVITRKKSRHRWLSRSFAALWDKSDAVTPKGDENPPGADPITDSQDPKVRDPQVVVEKRDAGTAVIAASFRSWDAETHTVRYDMVREGGAWKIDDIHTKSDSKADNYQWSTRKELAYNVEAMRSGRWITPPKDSPNAQRMDK